MQRRVALAVARGQQVPRPAVDHRGAVPVALAVPGSRHHVQRGARRRRLLRDAGSFQRGRLSDDVDDEFMREQAAESVPDAAAGSRPSLRP